MSKYGIQSRSEPLTRAIRKSYPELSDAEVVKLLNVLISEVARHIASGEQVAFLKKKQDGDMELTVLGMEVISKEKTESP